jgi:hypothetical protein
MKVDVYNICTRSHTHSLTLGARGSKSRKTDAERERDAELLARKVEDCVAKEKFWFSIK